MSRREQQMVPEPEFTSYYGRPILKQPAWKQPDVPIYLWVGGLGGAAALLAEGAALGDRPALETYGRVTAAGAAVVGTIALIHDLGRPARFLNMLRMLKVTSPLSVGSFILAPFGGLTAAAAASHLTGRLPVLGRLAGLGAAGFAAPLATYTAALICDTAVPAWHEAYREMPFIFAGSGAAAGGGLALAFVPVDQAGPARALALAGVALEGGGIELMKKRIGMHAETYEQGRPGTLLKTARALNVAGAAGIVVGGRSRVVAGLSGLALASASLMTRFGVFQAGLASAADPKYVVIPQKERIAKREAEKADGGKVVNTSH